MSGRVLETLIAERIFGWRTHYYANIDILSAYTEEGEISIPGHFSPKDDLLDAWRVINELSSKGIFISIDTQSHTVAAFRTENEHNQTGTVRRVLATETWESDEKDLPMKICMAALCAWGVPKELFVP